MDPEMKMLLKIIWIYNYNYLKFIYTKNVPFKLLKMPSFFGFLWASLVNILIAL